MTQVFIDCRFGLWTRILGGKNKNPNLDGWGQRVLKSADPHPRRSPSVNTLAGLLALDLQPTRRTFPVSQWFTLNDQGRFS